MESNGITKINGKGVYVAGNDIDTDRIIPARFLKCVTFDELGPSLFFDERFDTEGKSKNHPLDAEAHRGAEVLMSDANFGCGSSREHAPQALQKFGIKAVIAESFAEIFQGNSTTLGIPCVVMEKPLRQMLAKIIENEPEVDLTVDLNAMQVICANQIFPITMKESSREAFLAANYDPLDTLLQANDAIKVTAQRLGYI
tara:strand:+ start:31836 stop:32432 length:597 start_codon:yes stop_codon:yes gene_type:complete